MWVRSPISCRSEGTKGCVTSNFLTRLNHKSIFMLSILSSLLFNLRYLDALLHCLIPRINSLLSTTVSCAVSVCSFLRRVCTSWQQQTSQVSTQSIRQSIQRGRAGQSKRSRLGAEHLQQHWRAVDLCAVNYSNVPALLCTPQNSIRAHISHHQFDSPHSFRIMIH